MHPRETAKIVQSTLRPRAARLFGWDQAQEREEPENQGPAQEVLFDECPLELGLEKDHRRQGECVAEAKETGEHHHDRDEGEQELQAADQRQVVDSGVQEGDRERVEVGGKMMGPQEDVDSVGAVGKEAKAIDPRLRDLLGGLLHPVGIGVVPLREVGVDGCEELARDEAGEQHDQERRDPRKALPS
jgi:hypothetical protein